MLNNILRNWKKTTKCSRRVNAPKSWLLLLTKEVANVYDMKLERGPPMTTYIPALGHSILTPLYDSTMKWLARESEFKPKLIAQAKIQTGSRVLDLGCGTGTLTILIKEGQPEAEVVGIDVDLRTLGIARKKVARAGFDITLDLGSASKLPYSDDSFDRVVSSLVFHHLTPENKVRTLKEILRVLKPEGELHVADLGKPQNAIMRLPSLIMGHLEESAENVKGLIPHMLKTAGFEQVEETNRIMTMFGTIALYKGRKPLAS